MTPRDGGGYEAMGVHPHPHTGPLPTPQTLATPVPGIGRADRVRFTVFRSKTDPTLHRLTSDELTKAGPRLTAILTEPPNPTTEEWHPAWQTDPMHPKVEVQSREIIHKQSTAQRRGSVLEIQTGVESSTTHAARK
jgi:hypothetical protein